MSKEEILDVKKLENGDIVQRVVYRNAADGLRHTEFRKLYTKDEKQAYYDRCIKRIKREGLWSIGIDKILKQELK